MKNRIFLAAITISLGLSGMCYAQQDVTPGQKKNIPVRGHFNGTTPAGGSVTAAALAPKILSAANNVQYTKRDTVSNTAADSFSEKISGNCSSVYTWVNTTGISGTNTSCRVRLYVSGDTGVGLSWVPVYVATVTAINPAGYHLINSGNQWPYSNFKWVFEGVGTHSTSWYGGMIIK